MNKTTLYNHKYIGTSEKPLIPQMEFKKLIEYVKINDIKNINILIDQYTLHPEQINIFYYCNFKYNKINPPDGTIYI